ncbi:hypothetical protein SCOR_05935 [Sulfidibacter corallicola]
MNSIPIDEARSKRKKSESSVNPRVGNDVLKIRAKGRRFPAMAQEYTYPVIGPKSKFKIPSQITGKKRRPEGGADTSDPFSVPGGAARGCVLQQASRRRYGPSLPAMRPVTRLSLGRRNTNSVNCPTSLVTSILP